jgi:rubrerythrin
MRIEEKNGNLVIVDFNELEALKIASRIENDGIRFYTRLAASAGAPKVRETLELLAFQEKDHLEFFRKELQRLREKREDPFEEDDLLDSIDYGIFQPYQSMADLEKALDTPRKA